MEIQYSRSRLVCFIILLITTLFILPEAFSDPAPKPDLTGQIQTREGTGISGVTVFIETAGPKVGTSSFCPSCYPDCIKKAKTDAQGNFKIESLDPKLIFRLLVAGSSYKPKYVSKVDPAKGPIKATLELADYSNVPVENTVHGRIEDVNGKPITGAVVESLGIHKKDGGATWGSLPGVDPLAVTDEQGKFIITSKNPFASLDVKVTATGFAKRTVNELAGGGSVHKLKLTEGAVVKGRVLRNGKPLPNVSVGIAGANRSAGNFVGNFDIGTDSDGRFLFMNLPPNTEYFIYGDMETMKEFGAIGAEKITAGADGTTLDVGDLIVKPSHRLAGQVVLADGKPVPDNTRLLITRREAWDSMQIILGKDGRFDVGGIPNESIGLSTRVTGYRVSAKNKSLDTLNPFGLVGRVNRDITNLVVLMEKGNNLEPDYNSQAPESEWPANKPLRGAEGADDHSDQLKISGRAIDADTREPIAKFQVTPGRPYGMSRGRWNPQQTVSGTNGNFSLYVDKNLSSLALKIEADGYLPLTCEPKSQTESQEYTLKKGSGPKGRVLLPNGEAAAGITVVMLCKEDQAHLDGKGEVHSYQNKKHQRITDSEGMFAFEPDLEMVSVVAAGPDGFRMVTVGSLAANSNIVLEAYGTIKGTLKRPDGPGKQEDLDVSFDTSSALNGAFLNLACHAVTDAEGKFEFTHVPPGKLKISYRIKMNQFGWRQEPLQQVTLKPQETLEVNISAPEKKKEPELALNPSTTKARTRKPGPGPKGTVLLPNGKPAADAEVALKIPNQYIALGRGNLKAYDSRRDGNLVTTGEDGRFELPNEEQVDAIIAVHKEGYAQVTRESLKSSSQIKLQSWGRIEGTLKIGNQPGTNQTVLVKSSEPGFEAYYDFQELQAKTDDQGHFTISQVPPGEQQIVRLLPTSENSWKHGAPTPVAVKAGEVTTVTVGGSGRSVKGKLVIDEPANKVNWSDSFSSIHNSFPKQITELKTDEERKAWMKSADYKAAMKAFRAYPLEIKADGSFQVEEVPPGKYTLTIQLTTYNPNRPHNRLPGENDFLGAYETEISIPEPKNKSDFEIVDLGSMEMKPAKRTAKK